MITRKDWLEQVLYWGMLFALAVFVTLLLLDLIIRPWLPEEVAFVLGFATFYLLANTLFFGYGSLSAYLDKLAKSELTEADRQKAYEKSGASKHGLIEQLTHYGIATIWLDRYSPYRYAYLGLYLLLAASVLTLNLNLVSGLTTGSILEGLFWGATLVSVFVLAADSVVRWQYAHTVAEPVYQTLAPALMAAQAPTPEAQEQEYELAHNKVCPDPDDKECQAAVHEAEKTDKASDADKEAGKKA
ncbi:hypothetical protein SAMN05443662_0531 [Sulfurivirga caldicuralii]|uniref:Uncharacterized protein n=1 Tax=Sulfurivirga caldicuralii TaxID=364032 RepID=A0A1N6E155_9GAMM|nr:hypothetical protein [Sulfurivirga caldicuralii]SIN76760.1 hypothetical protein SAMN05443662_0531 [Sulfurivirga caldicuralii]